MYDFAQKISHLRFGWMILGAMLSASLCAISSTQAHIPTVLISFPPCIGHTTTVTLCGFAYGMKGFYIAAAGSVLGSAIVFVVLRLLFSKRLRSWSSSNEKWQALEAVIVRSSNIQRGYSAHQRSELAASLSSCSSEPPRFHRGYTPIRFSRSVVPHFS